MVTPAASDARGVLCGTMPTFRSITCPTNVPWVAGVGVGVTVSVGVGVTVMVGVAVGIAVGIIVGVTVGVGISVGVISEVIGAVTGSSSAWTRTTWRKTGITRRNKIADISIFLDIN
jgi:hypothetical protein